MTYLPYHLDPAGLPAMGLIVLQVDETIEPELNRYFAARRNPLYITRIPSGMEVTTDTLSEMQSSLPAAAGLLPGGVEYAVVGYGCTSASSVIGSERVEALVQSACPAAVVTNPLRAAIAACENHGINRLALLSPYIDSVNAPLIAAFEKGGIEFPAFGTFGEAEEAKVARISHGSVVEAAYALGQDKAVDGVFLSCTNLRTLDAIPELEDRLGKPVLSSNQCLAWHMGKIVENA